MKMLSKDEQERIKQLEDDVKILKQRLLEKEEELNKLLGIGVKPPYDQQRHESLTKRDITRYSRQMVVPQIKVEGQLCLKNLSVLIIGVGGLGCPAALYLAGAGIGRIGLVDYDVVEENNLHRQLLHCEDNIGIPKVESAARFLRKINKTLEIEQYQTQLSSGNALDIVREYDVVVDASDNVATRYLVSDACVLAGKPLVSGSALQLEGQLTVYNHAGGPCYRCLFPQPPPPSMVTNCSDAGVLGPVPGVIGTLQALEVMKIALELEDVLSSKLLLFDGESSSFRSINLRKKNENCSICGDNPTITQLIDYEQFCGAAASDKDKHLTLLNDSERILPKDLNSVIVSESQCIVVDVRQETEFHMCSIPGSVNIPLPSLMKNIDSLKKLVAEKEAKTNTSPLLCMVCRRGNDSQLAVKKLQPLLSDSVRLVDLKGGLHSWASQVDPQFPIY